MALGEATSRVKVAGVSKRFSRDLRTSLRYGVQDIMGEFSPFPRRDVNLRPSEFWALRDVSFEIQAGDALAVIGGNGAGKSSLLKLLNGVMKPDTGEIRVAGRVGALIELGTGFHPTLTGRENIQVNAALLGLPKRQLDEIVDQITDFAELGEFIDAPLQDYSSGMYVRLGYAIAAHLQPDILLADEVLTVGDPAFQRKCIQHMLRFLGSGGTMILVSHNLYLVQTVCARCIVLEGGKMAFDGSTVEGVKYYFDSKTNLERPTSAAGIAAPSSETPIVIEDVELVPVNGSDVYSEAPTRVVLHYNALDDVEAANWGFSFWTADLGVCIGAAWRTCSPNRLKRGRGELCAVLPHLSLTAGTYAVRAAMYEDVTGVALAQFGWQTAPAYVSVKSHADRTDNVLAISKALVKLDVRWE